MSNRALRKTLHKIQNKCCWCGRPTTLKTKDQCNPRMATVEHLRPVALGGSNKRYNLALACHECNQIRGRELADVLRNAAEDVRAVRKREMSYDDFVRKHMPNRLPLQTQLLELKASKKKKKRALKQVSEWKDMRPLRVNGYGKEQQNWMDDPHL